MQACRFLALDIDARAWPEVGRRDPVIGGAQAQLPGLRPCGFHSPYEAAAWAVLAQRLRIAQAARLRAELTARYGEDGAFPAPPTLLRAAWIFQAVRVSICGRSPRPRSTGCWTARRCAPSTPVRRIQRVQQVKGLGPFRRRTGCSPRANAPTPCPAALGGLAVHTSKLRHRMTSKLSRRTGTTGPR